MSLTVGSKAPQFAIFDTEKNPFTNETIAGKNTLLLFPVCIYFDLYKRIMRSER